MKRSLKPLLLLTAGLLLACSLTGCTKKHTLTVYADGDYISQALIADFTEETGIEVNYVTGSRTPGVFEETLFADTSTQTAESAINEALSNTNEAQDPYDDPYSGMTLSEILQSTRDEAIEEAEANAEKKGDASIGEVEYGPAVYDVMLTDGATLGELRENGLLLPLDYAKTTNVKNINENFTHLEFDPDGKYTITTMWETMGLLWNTQLVDEQQTSWDSLWNANYAGQILMPSNQRDCLEVALLSNGQSVNDADESALNAAFDKLEEQKPLVAEYSDRDAFILMENNRAALYPCYSGDALAMMSENSALAFLIPADGTYRITFGYGIAADSVYSEEAMQFVNYMCSATNLAKNAVYSKYSVTSENAINKLDDNWRTNPIAYPDESVLKDTQILSPLSPESRALCKERWAQLIGSAQADNEQANDDNEGGVS